LFEVGPGLNWENAGVRLLAKEVLGPLCSTSILEEGEGPEDFFFITGELIQDQAYHDLAKQLSHYLYFFSFLFLFFYLRLTT